MGSKEVEVGLKVLIGVIFLGWIMIWIMMPTSTYSKIWSPKIKAKANTAYFETLGGNLVLLASPMFVVTVLACFCLHLEQKRSNNGVVVQRPARKNKALAFLKRPLITRGPLGIITAMELSFFLMFISLVIWCVSVFLYTSLSKITHQSAMKSGHELWKMKLNSAAVRVGMGGNLCLAFLFYPVTRGSSLLPLLGLTSESSVRYHIWMGHVTMVFLTLHGIMFVIYWGSIDQISQMIKWARSGASNVAGELSLLAGLAMWLTTFPLIRRKMYEVFYYTHQLYFLVLLFFGLHVGMGHFFWTLPGVFLFLLDRCLRYLQSISNVRLISARVLPSAVELNFAMGQGFDYNPTSSIFVQVPAVSNLQWHPFTVSSSSRLEPERLTVVVKREGNWTRKLHDVLSSDSPPTRLQISVEGPYGPNCNRFLRYDSLVLISGGSGITPFIAVIREHLHLSTTTNSGELPTIHLISAFKTSSDLTMLDLLLPIPTTTTTTTPDISNLRLRIDAFVTRETTPATTNTQPQTLCFKPSPSDIPISPVLGRNGWLWLAAMITSSFLGFLLLLGLTTRYYFYPRDEHNFMGFSAKSNVASSSRYSLIMLLICLSVSVVAFLALIWGKMVSGKEIQVQSVGGPTPGTSPENGWVGGAGRELESLPYESVRNVANVRYGSRPGLKKMLSECDSNIITGVFVSGPPAMRREVALICGSGELSGNLQYESLSFSW